MIEISNLTKKFEDFTAIDNLDCTIPDGCIYGMVGSNGAGKSTFLRCITGIFNTDGGQVLLEGETVFENPTAKAKIAFVPDDLYFLPGANMKRMSTLYKRVFPNYDQERFEFLTKAFKLDPKKPINTFSKGMKRQVAIILALSTKAKYLFFDETFDGLDPVMRKLVKRLICEDVIERQTTVIITSHSLRELEDTCDQLALLHKGGLILQSSIQNIKTSLFKIQIAFSDDFDKEKFEGFNILNYNQHGSVATIIARGNSEEMVSQLKKLSPILLDILPLTLEEMFTYEMEALGYSFEDVLEREEAINNEELV